LRAEIGQHHPVNPQRAKIIDLKLRADGLFKRILRRAGNAHACTVEHNPQPAFAHRPLYCAASGILITHIHLKRADFPAALPFLNALFTMARARPNRIARIGKQLCRRTPDPRGCAGD